MFMCARACESARSRREAQPPRCRSAVADDDGRPFVHIDPDETPRAAARPTLACAASNVWQPPSLTLITCSDAELSPVAFAQRSNAVSHVVRDEPHSCAARGQSE